MKNFFQLILAGIIGGSIAFAVFKTFDKDTVIYEQIPPTTYYTNAAEPVANDEPSISFVNAAEKLLPTRPNQ